MSVQATKRGLFDCLAWHHKSSETSETFKETSAPRLASVRFQCHVTPASDAEVTGT